MEYLLCYYFYQAAPKPTGWGDGLHVGTIRGLLKRTKELPMIRPRVTLLALLASSAVAAAPPAAPTRQACRAGLNEHCPPK